MSLVEFNSQKASGEGASTTPAGFRAPRGLHRHVAPERLLMVAVGFSPRTAAKTESRRVATLESDLARAINCSSVATRRPPISRSTRGLKPTATIVSSPCDEIRLRSYLSSA